MARRTVREVVESLGLAGKLVLAGAEDRMTVVAADLLPEESAVPFWVPASPEWVSREDLGAPVATKKEWDEAVMAGRIPATAPRRCRSADAFAEGTLIVLESDSLVVGQHVSGRLQAEACAFAAQQTGLPYAAIVYSGSKSAHIYLRLDTAPRRKAGGPADPAWREALVLLSLALGQLDIGVAQQSGGSRLVRLPGGRRDTGERQEVWDARPGQDPISLEEVVAWAEAQLAPAMVARVRAELPRIFPSKNEWRNHPLRLRQRQWANIVGTPCAPGEGLNEQWFRANMLLAEAGMRQPVIRRRPNIEQGDMGDISAPYLWWVQAYVANQLSAPSTQAPGPDYAPLGYVFSGNAKHWPGEFRTRWTSEYEQAQRINDPVLSMVATALGNQAAAEEGVLPPVSLPLLLAPPPFTAVPSFPAASLPPPPFAAVPSFPAAAPPVRRSAAPDLLGGLPPVQAQDLASARMTDLLRGLLDVRYYEGDSHPWRVWDGRVWRRETEQAMLLRAAVCCDRLPDFDKDGTVREVGSEACKRVILALQRRPGVFRSSEVRTEDPFSIPFANGTLFIDTERQTVEFRENFWDKEQEHTVLIDHAYDPAMPTPRFDSYLQTVVDDDQTRDFLCEFLGYCLLPSQAYKAFLLLVGHGNTGKTTFMELARDIVGEHATGAFELSDFSGSHWAEPWVSRKLMVCGDAGDFVGGNRKGATALLKKISGGDSISVNPKGYAGYSTILPTKIIIGTNEVPSFRDGSDAVWNRLCMVQFSHSFTADATDPKYRSDPYIRDKLRAEIPGILVKITNSLRTLMARGKFQVTDQMKEDREQLREASDIFTMWYENCVRFDLNAKHANFTAVYDAYKIYCTRNQVLPCSKYQFRAKLKRSNTAHTLTKWQPKNIKPDKWNYLPRSFDPAQINFMESIGGLVLLDEANQLPPTYTTLAPASMMIPPNIIPMPTIRPISPFSGA